MWQDVVNATLDKYYSVTICKFSHLHWFWRRMRKLGCPIFSNYSPPRLYLKPNLHSVLTLMGVGYLGSADQYWLLRLQFIIKSTIIISYKSFDHSLSFYFLVRSLRPLIWPQKVAELTGGNVRENNSWKF